MDDFCMTQGSFTVEANWMADDTAARHNRLLEGRTKRFRKRMSKLSPFIVGVRERRTEVRLRIKRHPTDVVGVLRWINLMTRGNLVDDERFMESLLPK